MINVIKAECQKDFFNQAMSFTEEPLVSIDFNHNKKSSIVDILESKVISNNFARIVSWYDNEWGFANRMMDFAKIIEDI